MLVIGAENITQDPVELDILDELRLYFQAFNERTLRQSGKRLDEIDDSYFLRKKNRLFRKTVVRRSRLSERA